MGEASLHEELPNIAALLPQASGHREQAAAVEGTTGSLDTVTDFALNHRLEQGTFYGVVGGLDSLILQESPQPTCHILELMAGAHCAGPRRSLAPLLAQLYYPLQRCLNGMANRESALLQAVLVDRSLFVVVPPTRALSLGPY